ncbi:ABC transporter permease [Enterocloster clostridioformis]|nr:ABC transporter permease [Enterocloster clostridioformis]QQR02816.1 ABC transporter permease [Enterocloster clostridioformis]
MNTIRQSITIGVRGIQHLIHHPISMVFTLFNPLVWFFIYGQLFKGVAQMPGFPTDNYSLFVLPGVLGIAVLSVTLFNANNVVFDRTNGYFAKLLSFPIPRMAIAMGYAFDTMIQMLIILTLLFIIGLPFTDGLAAGWLGGVLVYVLSIMFGFSMTCLGLSMSLLSATAWEFFGMVNFIELPMFFMSGALFPQNYMPKWLYIVSQINPLSHYVNAVRTLYIKGLDWIVIGTSAGILLIFNIALFLLVNSIYRKVVAV